MKTIYTSLIFFILSTFFSSLTAQQLVSYNLIQSYTIPQVQSIANSLGVPNGLLQLEHEVNIYKVIYNTPAPDGTITTVSAAVVVPQNYSCPLPIANYSHGTTHHYTGVPSYMNREADLGIVFGSTGYIITMPDLIGLGDSPYPYHPYMHGETSAKTTVNAIRSAREMSEASELDFALNGQIFLFGYSQGGHTAMVTHKYIQENLAGEMQVAGSAPMSGPYDVSGAQTIYITADNPYPTPGYLPYVMLSYNEVYGLVDSPSEVLKPPYDVTLPAIFFDKNQSMGDFNNACTSIPNQVLVPSVLEDFRNDPDHFFRVKLRDNDVHDWTPTSPISMLYCAGDDQVSALNSENAYANFIANGATEIYKTDFGDYDHNGCVEFCMLAGKSFFDGRKDATNGMTLDFVIVPESAMGANDGSITVVPSGGAGNYTYTWDTGSNSATITGLSSNFTYEVTVMDDLGCMISQQLDLGFTTGVFNQAVSDLKVFPVPAKEVVVIEVPSQTNAYDIRVTDVAGRVVFEQKEIASGNFVFNRNGLPNGMYLIELQNNQSRHLAKMMFN